MIIEILFKIKTVLILKNGEKNTRKSKVLLQIQERINWRTEEEEGRDKGRREHGQGQQEMNNIKKTM